MDRQMPGEMNYKPLIIGAGALIAIAVVIWVLLGARGSIAPASFQEAKRGETWTLEDANNALLANRHYPIQRSSVLVVLKPGSVVYVENGYSRFFKEVYVMRNGKRVLHGWIYAKVVRRATLTHR